MSSSEKILIVDDDRDIRDLVTQLLKKHGFEVAQAADGDAMQRALRENRTDLIILDLTLPGKDGLALCRDIRAMCSVPIIILTARGEPVDRIVGLEIGADDYLGKPFEPLELVARIRSVLRRGALRPHTLPTAPKAYRFAGWTLDLDHRRLERADGTIVMLSGAEFRMLTALAEHANRVLSRDQLINLAKGRDVDVFDRAVDLQISRLRVKLGDDGKHPRLIKTVRGEGYVLSAPIETIMETR